MAINEEVARAFLRFVMKQLRECTHERYVQTAVVENFRALDPVRTEELLRHYRALPEVRERVERALHGLDELAEGIGETPLDLEKAMETWLREWKPAGPQN